MLYVIALLNHMTNSSGVVPITAVTGQVADVSGFLNYHFWQLEFFEEPNKVERLGLNISPKRGDVLTYNILTCDTNLLIKRSNIRPAQDPMHPNKRALPPASHLFKRNSPLNRGEVVPSATPVLHSLSDAVGVDPSLMELPKFSTEELIGLNFLRETPDGNKIRAKVTRKILDKDAENHQNIKFLVSCGDNEYEEIIV